MRSSLRQAGSDAATREPRRLRVSKSRINWSTSRSSAASSSSSASSSSNSSFGFSLMRPIQGHCGPTYKAPGPRPQGGSAHQLVQLEDRQQERDDDHKNEAPHQDRKSTRLNSSHLVISY